MISFKDRKKIVFIIWYGLFEFWRMGFGFCNVFVIFFWVMNLVLCGLIWSIVLVFLDDVLVLGSDFDDYLVNL